MNRRVEGHAALRDTETGFDFGPQDAAVVLRRHTEILELIAAAAPLKTMLERILQAIEELIPDAYCSILLLDRSGQRLHHGAAPRLPSAYIVAIDGLRPGPSAGSCGTAAYLNERVIVPDVRLDPRWQEYRQAAQAAGLVACWSTPIPGREGFPSGTFAVYHRRPQQPSARELRLVDRFTYLASVAIEHSHLVGDLIENEELFRRSFEDNAAGMALLALDQRIERVNHAMVDITGYTASELTGQPLGLVFTDDAWAESTVAEMLAGRLDHITQQTYLRTGTGDQVPVEATAAVVRGADNRPRLFAITVLDLTERQAVEAAESARREAEVARRTADEHSRAKSELLTAVSHEVRSPLQAIKGFTELLGTLDLDGPRRQEALRRINTAADHLLALVTEVLDISRVEADVLPLNLEDVQVVDAVRDAIDLVAAEADARAVEIRLRAGTRVAAYIDRRRLVQIVLNLLANAVRHGAPAGLIEVLIEEEEENISVTVSDNGPGIPADLLPHLFTPFVRGSGVEVDGYGLGLVLASSLATAMGGDLTVENRKEGGARFRLRLRPDIRGEQS
ncbi:ATP-binding protein [Nocardioides sp. CPCC 206347]|uniref:sensor histidine kinase n=1 Tax=unclassified Nocardioides TaxID=2615069 RepID=UPI00361EBFEB